MAQMKPQDTIPVDSSCKAKGKPKSGPSKYLEQLHPTRSGNSQNNTWVHNAKGTHNNFSLFMLFL